MPKKPIKFERFTFQANWLYKTVGIQPYYKESGQRSLLLDVLFFVCLVNLNFVLISELIFVVLATINASNFLEVTENLSKIGFVFVGDIKIWQVWSQKSQLTELMRDLRALYPQSAALQRDYGIARFLRNYDVISLGFIIIHLILGWSYNLFWAVSYLIYDYWLGVRVVPQNLPYYCWVPWDWHDHWSYYAMYASQSLAGHTCINGQLATDLWLCFVATQVILHFRYLARLIEAHVAGLEGALSLRADMQFLREAIVYHQKILHITEAMNEIFGIALLCNFLSSSFIMCFLGFQLTIGGEIPGLFMLFLFLFCSLVQLYMISNYAQDMISASENIGNAVYNHDWQKGDLRYRKMLVLFIQRAQKPAIMKATSFLNISLGTMTDLMQLSYKFFALLRTMYAK